ncbi:transposase [Sphingopyxis flava]|uniref:Transposase n=1 Tax=Sphingopyxis flava TaxID=1507287 RepID=A0A1T5GM26_9SPHN|nr:Transposase [Sphingopyxis flava]
MGRSEFDYLPPRPAWNAGRKVGAKRPLKPRQIWAIRFHLDREHRLRDRALFDLAIDSKLRGCDLVKIKIGDLVADRFHVIRLLNQHFLEGWKRFDPEGRKNRGLLSLMRRHRWKLSEEQRKRLAVYLKANPVLEALYTAKQDMALLLTQKSLNAKKASQLIPDLLRLIDQFAASPLKSLADTLTSWLEPVARMWRFSRNNGITEGFHTKMEMISRRAFGFRNFHNYRLRVLALCGWNGVINRV